MIEAATAKKDEDISAQSCDVASLFLQKKFSEIPSQLFDMSDQSEN